MAIDWLSSSFKFLKKHWPPFLLAGFVLVLHRDMLLWAVPGTGDHLIHMYRGWLMSEHLIPSGRITGWSHMAFAGYPAGVYYPILGDLLISGFRFITFGALSWERTYTLLFLILLVSMPLVVYAVARKVSGQMGALAAAVLSVGDVGGWPQGGHYSTVHWAVWPYTFGLTLAWLSLSVSETVMRHPVRRRPEAFLGFAVLLAATALAHPMTAFFLGLGAPILVVAFTIAQRKQTPLHLPALRAGGAAAIGVGLAAFWIVPWMTGGGEWTFEWPTVGFGGAWLRPNEVPFSMWEMTVGLFTNTLFKNFYWLAWGLGFLGIALGVISKKMWPTYLVALLIIAFVFTGICNSLGDTPIHRKVQIERMAAFMKFIWFVLAGFAVDRVGRAVAWALDKTSKDASAGRLWRRLRPWASQAAGLAFVITVIAVGWKDVYAKIAEIGQLGGETWDDIVRAETWLAEQPKGPLDRVLYQAGELCLRGKINSEACNEIYHRHIFASGPVVTGLPKLKFGYEATAIFKNLPLRQRWPADAFIVRRMVLEPDAFENLHVRWVVSLADWPQRDDMEEVKRFGEVRVYSVEHGKKPPVRLKGPGRISVKEFSDERIVVEVTGASDETEILYPVAYYYPWHAYRDGKSLKIDVREVLPGTSHKILMAVDGADGVTELLYERPLRERLAAWLSAVMWLGVLMGFASLIAVRVWRKKSSRGRKR